jgi:hypothetical protein
MLVGFVSLANGKFNSIAQCLSEGNDDAADNHYALSGESYLKIRS